MYRYRTILDSSINISILFFLFVCWSIKSFSQENKSFFVEDDDSYAILLDADLIRTQKNIQGASTTTFTKMGKEGFQYTFVISKIPNPGLPDANLVDSNYAKNYAAQCQCEVLEEDIVIYNNLETLRFKIKKEKANLSFIGYSDNVLSNKILYNFLFLTLEKDFNKLKIKHSDMMNNLIFSGGYRIGE